MLKIAGYEFYKLFSNTIVWIMIAVLLSGNLMAVYLFDRNTMVFPEQENYAEEYEIFVQEMEKRAQNMKKTQIFMKENSFVYRNLQKTCEDYRTVQEVSIKHDNNQGIYRQVSYRAGILFVCAFLAVLIQQVIFYERDKNLLLLVKVSRYGRLYTALGKWLVVITMTVLFVSAQFVCEFLYYGIRYGYGDMMRSIQSIPMFRNCAKVYQVGEYFYISCIIRILAVLVLAVFLYAISFFRKNSISTIIIFLVLLGIEYIFYCNIGVNSSINKLKCLNIFYYWDLKKVWGDYINLNIFEYPVNRNLCAWVLLFVSILGCSVIGIGSYVFGYQQHQDSILVIVLQKIRQRLGCHPKTTNLLFYEVYKILIQQKRMVLVAVLLILGVSQLKLSMGQEFYVDAGISAYHSYIQKLSGKITQETLQYLEDEEQHLKEISQELIQLQDVNTGAAFLRKQELSGELEMKQQGFYMVCEQVEWLKQRGGDIEEMYLVDEKAYLNLWADYRTDIIWWVIGSIAIIFICGGIFTTDKSIHTLLNTTRYGREKLVRTKYKSACILIVFVFAIVQCSNFYNYYKIDGFSTGMQSMNCFMNLNVKSCISLQVFVCFSFLLKFLLYGMVGICVLKISRIITKEVFVEITSVAVILVAAAVCWLIGINGNIVLLHFL